MYFKRLELHGFKSFAEPAIIEFHEGVTCIVGPNGSGKSNISDAIRWVLGEQSPKMLRGGKMEEVIFAGTANRKSRGMAEVTLVIDNTTGILPIDYNEVAITRRMYRSGESEYLINNNNCRLRDIRELIMDTGIGVDGYSIIGQGKISDIVSNKPESRREIFEEAAGVVMYKSKKAESERKLASASANLERVNDIIGEIEGRIDGLREDSTKAQEYLKLRDRFKELEINITLKSIEKLETASKSAQEDMSQLSKEIDRLSQEKKSLDEKLAQSRQKNDDLEQLGSQARDKLLGKVEEISELTGKSRVDAERLNTLGRDFERITEEATVLKEKMGRELESAEQLELQKTEILGQLSEADGELQTKIQASSSITTKVTKLLEEIDENRNKMYHLYNTGAAKRSEAKSMESYKSSLTQRKEQILEEKKQSTGNRDASTFALEKALEDKATTETALKSIEDTIQEKRKTLNAIEEEIREINKEVSHLKIQESQYNSRKKTIEEMENNYEGYNGAVRFIMKSGLRGVEGVAADLMEVPKGLEVAVETAMGASLQNIVCQTDEDAKRAVKALKENKAGRLTFLPVGSIRAGKGNLTRDVAQAQGMKGLACDLIKYNPKYENIFRYLLGRVAIVETMKDAIDLSKKTGSGVRFVTLEGEVVNASGAITGGKYKNTTANLLERKREIARLAEQIEAIKKKAITLEDNAQKQAGELETLNIDIQSEEEQAKTLQMETFNLNAKIESVKASYDELESNASRQEQQLVSIDQDLANAQSMAAKLEEEADECHKQGEEIQESIQSLMEEHEMAKEQSEKAMEEITATRIEKNKWDSHKENLMQMLQRVMDSVNDFKAQIEAKDQQLEALEKEKTELLFGSGDVEEAVKTKTVEKTELEEYIAKVTEEKTELSAKIEEMTKEQSSLGETLNSYQDQKYQQEIKLAKNETQLDTLKEKLWEDFEVSYLQAIEFKKDDFVMSTAQKESREIKNRLRELGDVNVGAIEEYAQVKERYEFLSEQQKDITDAMDQLQAIVDDMEKTIKSKFKESFDEIVINFEEIFKALFGGGYAELRLDDEDNPLEAGIEIVAQPPGKKLQNINLMSGGEKTMTAMALMFAVLKTRPTPFCILDEVEAALDDNNIDRFAKYLRKFEEIQFAIVTHQKATMEHADVLYGVTMPEQGISKLLSLRMGDEFDL